MIDKILYDLTVQILYFIKSYGGE